jgi:NitT/TauT family transport system ATP-binding protein
MRYPQNPQPSLVNIALSVEQGEFVSLVGPSGCGKTTLLKLCAGLLTPSAGIIEHEGRPGAARPGSYGIVFQTPALLPWRTISDNVILPLQVLRRKKHSDEARAESLLEMVGLGGLRSRYPSELSGGMQQRVSLARALIHDPDLLFMDEPFGALDAITRETLDNELQGIHQAQRKTVVFVTHNIQEAAYLSDRVVVMSANPGRIAAEVPVHIPRPRSFTDPRAREALLGIELLVREALDRASSDQSDAGQASVVRGEQ